MTTDPIELKEKEVLVLRGNNGEQMKRMVKLLRAKGYTVGIVVEEQEPLTVKHGDKIITGRMNICQRFGLPLA